MKRSFPLAGAVLAACFTATAFAQSDAPPPADGHRPHMQAPRTRAETAARVRANFARLDANEDGVLTQDELRPHGPSPTERQAMRDRMFAAMDKDGNGQISKAEFDGFHADHGRHRRGGKPEENAEANGRPDGGMRHHDWHRMMAGMMFRRADADHDGKVTLAEAEKAALDRFDRIDTDHDGTISDAEREAAHQRMAARFRERRAHWQDHKGDMPPPAPQG